MKPQKFTITIKSPSGHGNYEDIIRKEIQMWFWQRGYSETKVDVEEIFDTEIDKNMNELVKQVLKEEDAK